MQLPLPSAQPSAGRRTTTRSVPLSAEHRSATVPVATIRPAATMPTESPRRWPRRP
ncbi:hypothetical protein [Nonomuraea sp. JJY05]|uniref:hypothetical protein n=1 Tax=Nonomuraea sp. JJY05 TaxID=3350255 RepID=UPI00373FACBD